MFKRIIALVLIFIMMTVFVSVKADLGKMISTTDFAYQSFDTVTKRAKITFDLTVNTLSDGIIGIASSTIVPKAYSDYSICFRIRSGGFFDANDGSSFTKAGNVYYSKNITYKVELDADIVNEVYNAFVYVDGEKRQVADNYKFRASSESLGKITATRGGNYSGGLYYIENIVVEESEELFDSFSLPNVFCENMVLQRNKPHVIYGKGTGEITVTLSDGENSSVKTVVAENGRFKAELDALPAKLGAYTLTVSTKDKTITIENVFIGDVYLLAGQSNMAQTYEHQTTEQLGDGVTTSNMLPLLTDERVKFFKLQRTPSNEETFNLPFETDGWQPLNGKTNKKMSYIGMYFARERLIEEPNVPIGFMSVAWRGTNIDRWMRVSSDNKSVNFTPSSGDIYNNHIAPLTNYPISAILWYQGESDSKNPVMYEEAFKTLITDYRRLWNDDNVPFLFVQLARYGKDNYAPLRNAQMKALELENTGMAVILDTDKGTYNNIHPLGKEIVAQRLHLLAEKYVYGENIVASGPIFEKAVVGENNIIIFFKEDTIGEGLMVKNPYGESTQNLCEFEIADEKGYFVKANAKINDDNTITVWADGIKEPKFVRYAYSKVPENPNLFNKSGLPASSFTTEERIFSSDSFLSRGVKELSGSVQMVHFIVTPMKDNINGVMGFTEAENTVSAWNSCGITIRFHADGYLEYISGAGFVRSETKYKAGESYDVKIIADFTDNTYTLVVDDELICTDAEFRSGSLEMNNLGRFMIRGGDGEAAEEFFFDKILFTAPEKNTLFNVKEKGEEAVLAISPDGYIVWATYEGNALKKVSMAERVEGISFVRNIEGAKLYFWDKNLKPVE